MTEPHNVVLILIIAVMVVLAGLTIYVVSKDDDDL